MSYQPEKMEDFRPGARTLDFAPDWVLGIGVIADDFVGLGCGEGSFRMISPS